MDVQRDAQRDCERYRHDVGEGAGATNRINTRKTYSESQAPEATIISRIRASTFSLKAASMNAVATG